MCELQNHHFVVGADKIRRISGDDGVDGADSVRIYRFGTGVAKHNFCAHCGICPYYTPRSNPDGTETHDTHARTQECMHAHAHTLTHTHTLSLSHTHAPTQVLGSQSTACMISNRAHRSRSGSALYGKILMGKIGSKTFSRPTSGTRPRRAGPPEISLAGTRTGPIRQSIAVFSSSRQATPPRPVFTTDVHD